MAALPHLRRLPDRIDRILTLTSRGDLRIRHIVDEDGRRIVRTLANRALLVAVGAAFRRRGRRAARRRRPPARRSAATPACSRSSATSVCSPARCSCCASSPPSPGMGRHDRHVGSAVRIEPDVTPESAADRPTTGRALLPPPRRRRPPRAVGRGAPCCSSSFIELATATSDGVSTDLGGAGRAVPTSVRELLLAVTQVGGASSCPRCAS